MFTLILEKLLLTGQYKETIKRDSSCEGEQRKIPRKIRCFEENSLLRQIFPERKC